MTNRRQVIVSGCFGIASIGLLGVVSAEAEEDLNESFDPNSEQEVYDFVKEFDGLQNRNHQKDVFEDLTEEQQFAVHEVRKPESLVAEYDTVDAGIDIESTQRTYEHTVTMRQITGSVYYRFHHRLNWTSNGGEVVDYDSEGWVTDVAFGYNDDGTNQTWFDEHSDSLWVDSFRQRAMLYGVEIGGITTVTYYPYSELRGTQIGNRILRDEDDGV